MASWRTRELQAEARRHNLGSLTAPGRDVRASRRRRRWGQRDLAGRAGLSQSTISMLERGFGGGLTLDVWQCVARALDREVRVALMADREAEPADAGHIAMQELVLRLGRRAGFGRTFELPTRAADPSGWTDVRLRDDRRRLLLLVECWNAIGDLGAGARSSDRKRAEAEMAAVAIGPVGDDGNVQPYRVRVCWVVRATARNRALVARYPEVFVARFPGSSVGWVRALTESTEPPSEPGLVWCDVRATRLFAWRHRG